jgi:hypothetical protein
MKPSFNHHASEWSGILIYSQASFQTEDKKNLIRFEGKL